MSDSEDLYKKFVNKEKLSLRDKVKAKYVASRVLVRNSRLILRSKGVINKAVKRRDACFGCSKKIKELSKSKYSEEDAYKKICDGYFCEKCTPSLKEYFELMRYEY